MKRRMKKGGSRDAKIKDKAKSVNMMSGAPFRKRAKKPTADDAPHSRPLARSVNKNVPSARVKKLAGVTL